MTAAELSIHFFIQMAVIIAAARFVGWVAHRYLGCRRTGFFAL